MKKSFILFLIIIVILLVLAIWLYDQIVLNRPFISHYKSPPGTLINDIPDGNVWTTYLTVNDVSSRCRTHRVTLHVAGASTDPQQNDIAVEWRIVDSCGNELGTTISFNSEQAVSEGPNFRRPDNLGFITSISRSQCFQVQYRIPENFGDGGLVQYQLDTFNFEIFS